jgi:hypothetical protein
LLAVLVVATNKVVILDLIFGFTEEALSSLCVATTLEILVVAQKRIAMHLLFTLTAQPRQAQQHTRFMEHQAQTLLLP